MTTAMMLPVAEKMDYIGLEAIDLSLQGFSSAPGSSA